MGFPAAGMTADQEAIVASAAVPVTKALDDDSQTVFTLAVSVIELISESIVGELTAGWGVIMS